MKQTGMVRGKRSIRRRGPSLPLVSSLLWICTVLMCALPVQADAPQPIGIIAQGFDISQPRKGVVGQFPRVRIRVEAPSGIRELRIEERSYEVDLASTLDVWNLELFGLEQRARHHRDLTLNFQKYINSKIESEGDYSFDITVVDDEEHTVTAMLRVVAGRSAPEDAVEIGTFRLERIGTGPVLGSPEFGITWKTIEGRRVIIRITGKEGGAARIAKLTESAYEETQTKSALEKRVEKAQSTDHVELAAADNASAGAVLGVVFQGRTYALRVIESKTERAKFGTKVTLTGDYKF